MTVLAILATWLVIAFAIVPFLTWRAGRVLNHRKGY